MDKPTKPSTCDDPFKLTDRRVIRRFVHCMSALALPAVYGCHRAQQQVFCVTHTEHTQSSLFVVVGPVGGDLVRWLAFSTHTQSRGVLFDCVCAQHRYANTDALQNKQTDTHRIYSETGWAPAEVSDN